MEGLFDVLMSHLSIVIPVFNENDLIKELLTRVKFNAELITSDYEIIVIDDGSRDATWDEIKLEAQKTKKIKALNFSRNFGHHYAITAGLFNATGDWVVVMDGDLQDRPEVIPDLYNTAQKGFDIVFVSRTNRPESAPYRLAQKVFYVILNLLSGIDFDSRQANFSIINKKVVEAFKTFPENARFYATTVMWLGFDKTFILADHGTRHSGESSYTLKKRIKLALDIILAFSERPLNFAIGLGLSMSLFASLVIIYLIVGIFYLEYVFDSWLILLTSIFFMGGLILTILGIIGVYVGRIFNQVKNRPLYIIKESIGVTLVK